MTESQLGEQRAMTLQNSISETDQLSPTVFVFLSVSSSSTESLWAEHKGLCVVSDFRPGKTGCFTVQNCYFLCRVYKRKKKQQRCRNNDDNIDRKMKKTLSANSKTQKLLEIDKVEPFLLFEMFGNVTAPQQAWHMYCSNFVLGSWYSERQFHVFMERFLKSIKKKIK